jgi:hypothetical protein
VLEAADPHARERVVDGDVRTAPDERAAAARRALRVVAEDVVPHARHREGGRQRHHADRDREHEPPPAPGEDDRQHDAGGQRGEARL